MPLETSSIVIEKTEQGWLVRSGERWEDSLDTGEALYCVANLLLKGDGPYLRTQAQHDAWNDRYGPKKPLEDWQKQLAAVEEI
jgi:hypothetical protein